MDDEEESEDDTAIERQKLLVQYLSQGQSPWRSSEHSNYCYIPNYLLSFTHLFLAVLIYIISAVIVIYICWLLFIVVILDVSCIGIYLLIAFHCFFFGCVQFNYNYKYI